MAKCDCPFKSEQYFCGCGQIWKRETPHHNPFGYCKVDWEGKLVENQCRGPSIPFALRDGGLDKTCACKFPTDERVETTSDRCRGGQAVQLQSGFLGDYHNVSVYTGHECKQLPVSMYSGDDGMAFHWWCGSDKNSSAFDKSKDHTAGWLYMNAHKTNEGKVTFDLLDLRDFDESKDCGAKPTDLQQDHCHEM
jgi:hypothetical protein